MAVEVSLTPTEYGCKTTDHLLNPVIEDAAEALLRQNRKVQTINLEKPTVHEGLILLPNWEDFSITRLEQRRDTRDLRIRGKSAHNVSFGLANLRTPQGLQLITVAVKPFNEDYKAIHDAVSNAYVLKREVSTTDPICVIIDQGKGFIITPVKEGVQPLDTEPWHEFQTTINPEVTKHFRGGTILRSMF